MQNISPQIFSSGLKLNLSHIEVHVHNRVQIWIFMGILAHSKRPPTVPSIIVSSW